MEKHDHKSIEKKWQKFWDENNIFVAEDKSKKPKKFVLIEFPYPSGEGLHMGHLRPYVAGDVYSRFMRMQGFETMYPIGWDAFGLPAENYALKNKVHPSVSTAKNIANARKQLKSWGMGFDWSREINTTDPNYYKWTQWIFLQFFKAGLAYEATGLINWCPKDKTGLANEEVIDGRCERCGTGVEKREMRQWYLKITAYAEKLLEGLKSLKDWPEPVKLQQENWIGRSEGAEIGFSFEDNIKRVVILHARSSTSKDNFYPWLKDQLQNRGYDVQVPDMPKAEEPDDNEQADYVLKNCILDEQTAVIGHSFGGIVALRLLEKGAKLGRVTLVATPYSGEFLDGKSRPTVTIAAQKGFDFEKIKKNCRGFILLYDIGDKVVPMSDGEVFKDKLNCLLFQTNAQKSHFQYMFEPEVLYATIPAVRVFTTRPDTLFGATYLVLAPEHPLVKNLESGIKNQEEVKKYIAQAKAKTDLERSALEKEKTGVELKGVKAINPATKQEIPIWVADYVLMGYGTGAIMAVPAHDERDFAFAKKYNLPIKCVIDPVGQIIAGAEVETDPTGQIIARTKEEFEEKRRQILNGEICFPLNIGRLINSGKYNNVPWYQVAGTITMDFGVPNIQYKLRDWVFSRQRYWGEPIPIIHCKKCGIVPVPEDELPVELPKVEKYEPTGTGESPLAAIDEWVNTKCPNCTGPAKRETNTMPQWAGSSWYWLRYTDPQNDKELASKKLLKHWTPVDVYFGGMEHTTLHLLYSRFWNLFLFDQGHVTAKEPFVKRVPHGIVLAADGEKMSKSRGNVANPDDIVQNFGADTLRMYEMFLGPHEATVSWNDKGIVGVKRFLDKVWNNAISTPSEARGRNPSQKGSLPSVEMGSNIHKLIKKISQDIEAFKFNTAIAAFMSFLNENKTLSKNDWETFLRLLAPFAPHIAEELWHRLGHQDSIHLQPWPKFDEKLAKEENVTIVVQVLGKLRATLELPAGASQEEIKQKALADPNVAKHLEGKKIVKGIFVKDKLINFVTH